IGQQLEWPAGKFQSSASLVSAVEGFSQSFAYKPSSAARNTETAYSVPASTPAINSSHFAAQRLPLIVFVVWLCGAGVVVFLWFRDWRRMRISLNAASAVESDLPFPVLMTEMPTEPGIVGILRPLLLLPKGLTDRLTPEQFDAVLTHELCHVRRRDNLMAAIHMVVEALFWFHPMVWWIEYRLVEERERACDDEVLHRGSDPQAYAEGILSVCKFYKESALVCVSGVSGSDLKKRIEDIMRSNISHKLSFSRTVLLTVAGIAALAGPIAIGVVHAAAGRESDDYSFSTIDVPGSTLTVASGIDIAGRVAGYYVDKDRTHGFLLTNGSLATIDFPGAGWTAVYGVSSSGQIVGSYGPDGISGRHGFL